MDHIFLSDIQDCFEYISKNYHVLLSHMTETLVDNTDSPIRIHINNIEEMITFKIKLGHYLELLTPETVKLLGSTEKKITKCNGENGPYLKIPEVVLVNCSMVNSYYQHDLSVLYTFAPNKSFVQEEDIFKDI